MKRSLLVAIVAVIGLIGVTSLVQSCGSSTAAKPMVTLKGTAV